MAGPRMWRIVTAVKRLCIAIVVIIVAAVMGGRGARYRETRCDSYRKRCGGEAVSCGVTAMTSEGALLLVLRLVDPLVLFSRGVRLLIVGRGHDQFYVNQSDDQVHDRREPRGSMRKRVVEKGIFLRSGWRTAEMTWISYSRSVCYWFVDVVHRRYRGPW